MIVGRITPGRPLDAAARLARAIRVDAAAAGIVCHVRDWRSRPWSSATFIGERHDAVVTVTGDGAADWLAGLHGAEFAMPGIILADLAVSAIGSDAVRLEALTLDDG